MLVSTNDAFFALNGVKGPTYGSDMFLSPAYDAGSEKNSEDATYIPGPPGGNHVHDPSVAEGYVYIHSGIHGIMDLPEEMYDWNNPVAKIIIERVK